MRIQLGPGDEHGLGSTIRPARGAVRRFAIVTVFPDFLGRLNTRPEIFTLPLFVGWMDFAG